MKEIDLASPFFQLSFMIPKLSRWCLCVDNVREDGGEKGVGHVNSLIRKGSGVVNGRACQDRRPRGKCTAEQERIPSQSQLST